MRSKKLLLRGCRTSKGNHPKKNKQQSEIILYTPLESGHSPQEKEQVGANGSCIFFPFTKALVQARKNFYDERLSRMKMEQVSQDRTQ